MVSKLKLVCLISLFVLFGCSANSSEQKLLATESSAPDHDETFIEKLKHLDIPESFQLPEIIIGDVSAPNTLIIYSSFSCSHCAKFHRNEWRTLKNEWIDTGKLKVYLRSYVDDTGSLESAMLLRAYGQKKGNDASFYESMYQNLYSQQKEWLKSANPHEFLKNIFIKAGFDRKDVDECLKVRSKTYTKMVAGLMREQKKAIEIWNIEIIPAFIINDRSHCGFMTAKEIIAQLSSQ